MEHELTRPAAKAAFMTALAGHLDTHGFRPQGTGRGLHAFVYASPGGAVYTFKGSFTRQGDFHPLLQVHYPEVTAFLHGVAPWIAERQGTAVFSSHLTEYLDAANADGYLNSTGPHPYHSIPEPYTEARMQEWAAAFAAACFDAALADIIGRTDSLVKAEALLNEQYPVKPPRFRFAGSQRWIASVLTPYVPVHVTMGIVLAHLLGRPYVAELRDVAGRYLRRDRAQGNDLFDLLDKVLTATATP